MEQLLLNKFHRRVCTESIPSIKKCFNHISEEEFWFRPNETSNSIGNLILHLIVNAEQWIMGTSGED
jgi:hypothetical protein